MKVNPVLRTRLFRGDKLDMIDKTLNSKSAAKGSINLAANPLGIVKVNWIWAPVGSEVTN